MKTSSGYYRDILYNKSVINLACEVLNYSDILY